MEKKELKPIVFHTSFEDQKFYGQESSLSMTIADRLMEMYRLNRKTYKGRYGKISKKVELFYGLPGETVEDFYKRINSND